MQDRSPISKRSSKATDTPPASDETRDARAEATPAPTGDLASRPVVFRDDQRSTEIVYEVVEHDGGWAYRLNDSYSETFATRGEAVDAAARAAAEHEQPGDDAVIEYQDEDGVWREELVSGGDRPTATVEDVTPPELHQRASLPSARASAGIVAVIRARPWHAILLALALGYVAASRRRR